MVWGLEVGGLGMEYDSFRLFHGEVSTVHVEIGVVEACVVVVVVVFVAARFPVLHCWDDVGDVTLAWSICVSVLRESRWLVRVGGTFSSSVVVTR